MTQHVGPNNPISWPCVIWRPQLCWPHLWCHPISSNSTSWRCKQSIHFTYDPVLQHHITIQALTGNVACVYLYRCTNMYNIHCIVITNNPYQAYIDILTQQIIKYIMHHTVTRQWPLAVASEILAVATSLNIKESTIRAYSL